MAKIIPINEKTKKALEKILKEREIKITKIGDSNGKL